MKRSNSAKAPPSAGNARADTRLGPKETGTVGKSLTLSLITLGSRFLAGVGTTVIVARSTSADTLGEILYAVAFAEIVGVLASYGFDNLLVREAARNRNLVRGLAVHTILAKVALSLLCALLAYAFIAAVGVPLAKPGALWSYMGAALLGSYVTTFASLRKGENDFLSETQMAVFQGVLLLVATALAMQRFGRTTSVVGGARLLSRVFSFLFAVALFSFRVRGSPSGDTRLSVPIVRDLLAVGFPFAVQAILGTAYFRLDTLILGELAPVSEVGYYQTAMQVTSVAMMAPLAVIQAFFPRLARAFDRSLSEGIPLFRTLMWILVVLAIGIATVLGLEASPIIGLLYGTEMLPATHALRVLSLMMFARSIASGLGIALVSMGQQKAQVVAGAVALSGSMLLNVLLIPSGGFIAAAWVNLVINVTVLAVYTVWWRTTVARDSLLRSQAL